eukprot:COSAG03_NODE_17000_length_386_cov_1.243902_1_plen_57_part_01
MGEELIPRAELRVALPARELPRASVRRWRWLWLWQPRAMGGMGISGHWCWQRRSMTQ